MAVSRSVVVFLIGAVMIGTSDAAGIQADDSSPYCVEVGGNDAEDGIVDLLPTYTMVEKTRVFRGAQTINKVQIFAGAILPFKVGLFRAGPDNKFILKQQAGPMTPSNLGEVQFDLSGGNELYAEPGDHLGWTWTDGGVIAYTEDADSTAISGYAVDYTDEGQEFALSNEFNRVYSISVDSCATFELNVNVDNKYTLYVDGNELASGNQWYAWHSHNLLRSAQVVALKATNDAASAGIRVSSDPDVISTNLEKTVWKCIDEDESLAVVDWTSVSFDDSSWLSAVFSGRTNPNPEGPDGTIYIWTSNVRDNATVYCRGYIMSPRNTFTLNLKVDNKYALYVDGNFTATGGYQGDSWNSYNLLRSTRVAAVKATNDERSAGIRVWGYPDIISTNLEKTVWKCIDADYSLGAEWIAIAFNDSSWPFAVFSGKINPTPPGSDDTIYIWTSTVRNKAVIFCRGYVAPTTATCAAVGRSSQALINGAVYSIEDSHFTASNVWEDNYERAGPYRSRLNVCLPGGACGWVGKGDKSDNFITVDLGDQFQVERVAVQGRSDECCSQRRVTSFKLGFSNDGTTFELDDNDGQNYEGVLDDTTGTIVVEHDMKSLHVARYVRLYVVSFEGGPDLRWELYGCRVSQEIDECASTPCQNGATCVDEYLTYTCICPSGFVGQHCEIPSCVSREGSAHALISGPVYNVWDSQLSASYAWDGNNQRYGPHRSRLNVCVEGGVCGWVGNHSVPDNFITVDLGEQFQVEKVAVQGREDACCSDKTVTSFKLGFSNDGTTFEIDDNDGKNYDGVLDDTTGTAVITRDIRNHHVARYVRLYVVSGDAGAGLRWELYGCKECRFFVANYENGASSYFLDSKGAVTPVKLLSDRVFMPVGDGKGNMFYTSLDHRRVFVYRENGPEPREAEIAVFANPTRAIAVDPEWEVVFVSAVQNGIVAMNYNGGDQRVISNIAVDFPSSLAVDVKNKDLFFLARNQRSLYKINYQDLDNPSDEVVIYDRFPEFPRGLVIDYEANRMYLLMEYAAIWSINLLDQSDVSEMISRPSHDFGGFDLTMCAGFIYYSDYSRQFVWRISPMTTNGNQRSKFNQVTLGSLTRGITAI